jgi:hypothetical protein
VSFVWELDPTWDNSATQNANYYQEAMWATIEEDRKLVSNGIKLASLLGKVGKDSSLLWKEQEYYVMLVNYLSIMKEFGALWGYDCDSDEQETFIDEYDLSCVKNTYLCQYGTTGNNDFNKNDLLEVLVSQLTMCCDSQGDGISIMNINNPSCHVFTVYPEL